MAVGPAGGARTVALFAQQGITRGSASRFETRFYMTVDALAQGLVTDIPVRGHAETRVVAMPTRPGGAPVDLTSAFNTVYDATTTTSANGLTVSSLSSSKAAMLTAMERVLAGSRSPLDRVKALHHRRPMGPLDFRTHGQTDFGDRCDHCRSAYPCATILAIDADAGEGLDAS